ncbi:hypothetical protein V8E53_000871 [Lactarius tabidus]
MGQWLIRCNKYLHILLDMEGVTEDGKCSMCTKQMEIKCTDCIGGNYFCRECCLQAHMRSPFHRIAQWTGAHFAPTSLCRLGFRPLLGHNGAPCPLTVEVRHIFVVKHLMKPVEEDPESPAHAQHTLDAADDNSSNLARLSEVLFETSMDKLPQQTKRTRTARSGNLLITAVHNTGVFDLEILYCICPNASDRGEQLLQAQMFPSSIKNIETVFTSSVLDDFLVDNLECKTTAQHITNRMFPDNVPDLYRQLLQASRQWHDLQNRMSSGLGHQQESSNQADGSMAIFCPACLQPGINLPSDWKDRYTSCVSSNLNQLIRTFIMDGNFSAEHMQCRTGEKDVHLSAGMAFMANPEEYKAHLKSGKESIQPSTCNTYKAIEQANSRRPHLDVTGIGATACCHGFFVPASVVDFQKGERQINMDYSLCKALSYNMDDIPVALVMYDIMCQYGVHLKERVARSPQLSLNDSLELRTGIGLFHIHGHQDSCLPRYSPSYIPGAKQVDGEIIETLWAPLNNISRTIQGMSLAHRQEVLDVHMNQSNWKKMVHIVPSLLKRWKCLEVGITLSAETLDALSARLGTRTKRWLKAEQHAQLNRHGEPSLMDIYNTDTVKAPSHTDVEQRLVLEERQDLSMHGQAHWIASGIKIQELQLAIRYHLRSQGSRITAHELQTIDNRQTRLQEQIDLPIDTSDIPPLGNYDQYDHADDPDAAGKSKEQPQSPSPNPISRVSDGSGMDIFSPEDHPIILPSSLGWDWCIKNGEAQLHHAQANGAIHCICHALGFKSALFRTQQTKTRAWTAINGVDTTVHEHAYTFRNIHKGYPDGAELQQLYPKDLQVATLVLGSDEVGQRNTQQSWIWGFGKTANDKGTWMDDFERVHWLCAKAQFERWVEEQDSIHNEAKWVPAYFHTKAESWRKLMDWAIHESLKGHASYASYQMFTWEELSRSAAKSLTPISESLLKHFNVHPIPLS